MYSMMMMMAVAGSSDVSSFGGRKGGCNGDTGCHGSVAVASCHGGSGCDGGSGCHGGRKGLFGGRMGGGLFGKHKNGCNGGSCHGGSGCHGYVEPAPAPCCPPPAPVVHAAPDCGGCSTPAPVMMHSTPAPATMPAPTTMPAPMAPEAKPATPDVPKKSS